MTDSRELTTLDDDGYGVPSMVPQRGGHMEHHYDDGEHYQLPDTIDNGRDYDATEGASSNPALAKYTPPADLAKQMGPADWQIFDTIRPAAHKLGVTPKQFAGLTKAVLGIQVAQVDNANGKAEAVLKKHFGKDYGQALRDATAAAEEYGNSGFMQWLDTPVSPTHPGLTFGAVPMLVDLLARVGRAMRGASTVDAPLARNAETSGGMSMDKTAALAEANALRQKYPLGSATRPRAIDQRIQALMAAVYDDAEEDQTRNGLGPLNRR